MTTWRAAIATATLGLAGAAGAQPAPAPAPPPAAPAKDAKAPGKPADPKARPAAPGPTNAKAPPAPKAPPPPKPEPKPVEIKLGPPPPELPLPPEVDAMAKLVAGAWRCKGDEWDDRGGKGPITATARVKLELDGWWISETMEIKGQRTFKMIGYSTYDAKARKWRRVAVMNRGGQLIGTSSGPEDSRVTWSMELTSPAGAAQLRDHVDASDPKAGVKRWGELSRDRGRSWQKAYELVCKR